MAPVAAERYAIAVIFMQSDGGVLAVHRHFLQPIVRRRVAHAPPTLAVAVSHPVQHDNWCPLLNL